MSKLNKDILYILFEKLQSDSKILIEGCGYYFYEDEDCPNYACIIYENCLQLNIYHLYFHHQVL